MPFTRRSEFLWHLRTRSLALGARTLVMGVLNVTPDSFSDGGLYHDANDAIEHGLRMLDDGADILDIGGESTRPGQPENLSAAAEQERVLPVLAGILTARPEAVISIDTYKASTAHVAVDAGAEIVNDVSGFLWDSKMAGVCARLGCGVVLMHTRGRPDEWKSQPRLVSDEVLPLVKRELNERLQAALDGDVPPERIVLDPGYGFGKRFDENYALLGRQEELLELGQPLLAGVSRKSFLARTLRALHGGADAPMEDRLYSTLAATTAAILAGADIVRVHDVRPAVEAARIADALLASVSPHFSE
ncbi:dihydropteroate synthase [Alloacidobacterium dinghuense]|uniref:Dihydropteroate synthase n=1 Tax=Alloacidobacterium dinghuense TaxID=2763107 RepID=A0A7G8BFD8_9BACT|nr:dihydropteroate synthase [Alloacidobacterium dinghuense]QNI31258.1 dihydropteroate synthase [Alloacidobacterium dinghuense]